MINVYMRHPFFLPVACILLAGLCACKPQVSETTHIHGRIEGGTADLVTVTVLDYDILRRLFKGLLKPRTKFPSGSFSD